MAPYLKPFPLRVKAPLAYMLTDQAFAVSVIRFRRDGDRVNRAAYFFGATGVQWLTWQVSTAVGVFLGARVPEVWALDFAIPLTFMALLVPAITDRATLLAALAASITAVLARPLPYNGGLLVAAVIGIAVGMIVEGARS